MMPSAFCGFDAQSDAEAAIFLNPWHLVKLPSPDSPGDSEHSEPDFSIPWCLRGALLSNLCAGLMQSSVMHRNLSLSSRLELALTSFTILDIAQMMAYDREKSWGLRKGACFFDAITVGNMKDLVGCIAIITNCASVVKWMLERERMLVAILAHSISCFSPPFGFFQRGESCEMSRPEWTKGPQRWNPNPAPKWVPDPNARRQRPRSPENRERPRTVFSEARDHPVPRGRKRRSPGRDVASTASSDSKAVCLGQTTGVFAAGAWAARMEICSLLEGGASADAVISAIKAGVEGDQPLSSRTNESSSSQASQMRRPIDDKSAEGRSGTSGDPGDRLSSPATAPLPRVATGRGVGVPTELAGLLFRKKAMPPPSAEDNEEDDYLPTTPPSPKEEGGAANASGVEPRRSSEPDPEEIVRKRAQPPPESATASQRPLKEPPVSTPIRKDPRTLDKYKTYDLLVRDLFEDLILREVRLELVNLVFDEGAINGERLTHYTDPRSPDTGLRYGRLLKRYLGFFEDSKGEDCFSSANVGLFIEHLTRNNAGKRTPQAFLYTLEFFSVNFGFSYDRDGLRRWRRIADDYSKKAPPRSAAPLLSVAFLGYLEDVVLSNGYSVVERVTAGKLRLCIQASLRHSDLVYTPLASIEWCRDRGSARSLGIRARAPVTKSGPRPWVASFLGIKPEGDKWLVTLMKLMIESHGSSWRSHEFFGCAASGLNSFSDYPASLSADVDILKRMFVNDIEGSRRIPLTKEQALTFRWHSAKACMATCMTHLGVQPRIIRHQGAWKKASDTMIDLYLREGQSMVLKAQIEVLDKIRRGVQISILEGAPLEKFPWDSKSGSGVLEPGWVFPEGGPSLPCEAMEKAGAVHYDDDGHLRPVESLCPEVKELPEEFADEGIKGCENVEKLLQDERDAAPSREKIFDLPETLSETDEERQSDEESSIDPASTDVDMFEFFVILGSGSGKTHKPGPDDAAVRPRCGRVSKSFTRLELDEKWSDKYELCLNCFGPVRGCSKMCEFTVNDKNGKRRCGRRCGSDCSSSEVAVGSQIHACEFHAKEEV